MNISQQLKQNYPLNQATTLQIGGPATAYIEVKTSDELIEAVKYAPKNNLNFLVIGSGSNLLVSDDGFKGLVIKNEIT